MSSDFHIVRHTGEISAQGLPSPLLVIIQEHAGIIHKVGLGNHHALALGTLYQNRRNAPSVNPFRKFGTGIRALEIIDKDILERAFPFLVYVRDVRGAVLREAEISLLVGHDERLFGTGNETVRATLVVGAEHSLEALEFERKFIELFLDLGFLVDR